MIAQRLIGEPVEASGFGVPRNLLVETLGDERLEPGAKARQFVRRQIGHSLFDVSMLMGRDYQRVKRIASTELSKSGQGIASPRRGRVRGD